jgi:hypothetical protein
MVSLSFIFQNFCLGALILPKRRSFCKFSMSIQFPPSPKITKNIRKNIAQKRRETRVENLEQTLSESPHEIP